MLTDTSEQSYSHVNKALISSQSMETMILTI